MKSDMYDVLKQLSKKYPSDTILDIINSACEFKYPSHKKSYNNYLDETTYDVWKLTNEEIHKALSSYNEKDKMTHVR